MLNLLNYSEPVASEGTKYLLSIQGNCEQIIHQSAAHFFFLLEEK